MSKPIHQTVTFKASPHEVYEALMDFAETCRLQRREGQDQPSGRRGDHGLR